jgi:hypothetical protein
MHINLLSFPRMKKGMDGRDGRDGRDGILDDGRDPPITRKRLPEIRMTTK